MRGEREHDRLVLREEWAGVGARPGRRLAHVRRHDETQPGWHDPFSPQGRRGRQAPDDALRLGILYADGRRGATTGRYWRPDEQADPARPVVQTGSGGGNGRRWDGNFWVHPLPPGGPVTFVAAWPEYGVAETQAELDGAAIRAAAERAVTLWPEQLWSAGDRSF